ncbi:enolase C-terminal domain-like protein [Anaeromyxobacter oryzae]|uniref:Mandelate racemase n=1 Tax=Anaeromyxobacter oryzae TaxID=2918170 RepID=A0ABM7WY87_9BACT|nr:enolase C-terminal domain-like protein [Anaeromyxobacter oryzae]BDG04483.1 mandelate racemase [Anaeromyxobacter oryzae]
MARAVASVEALSAAAYRVPTDRPESDGTIAWDSTTLVAVEVEGGGARGFGYTYADASVTGIATGVLAAAVRGADALDPPAAHRAMRRAIRNVGGPGAGGMALSAVDAALWDLKAKLLRQPLAVLLGRAHAAVPVYGSGGFCSYTEAELQEQLGGWASQGLRAVKMKVGRDARADPARVRAARAAIGSAGLFVDANGAYSRKQALALAGIFAGEGVTWLEEPVSSDDLAGLRLIRDRAPPGMDVAAGEYGHDAQYFRRMLEAGAVDVLQADMTRCGGVTGFLAAAAVAAAFAIPLSSHCAPALHAAPLSAAETALHAEWFHDHVRIERMLLEGAPEPRDGLLAPQRDRPGFGLELKRSEAERYRVA